MSYEAELIPNATARPRNGRRHFAFAAEGRYSVPLATAVASLTRYLGPEREATIWVLDLDAEACTRPRVERALRRHARGNVELEWLRVSHASIGNLETTGHLVPVTYARLLLPSLLPDEIDVVVYLDSDLVIRDDVSELTQVELGALALAAVPDYSVQEVGGPRSGIGDLTSKPRDATYFNCGVIVMNLEAWRADGLADRVLSFAQRHSPLKHADQDALNAVVTEWQELPLHWNVQSNIHWLQHPLHTDLETTLERERPALLDSAPILHFSGPSKPWQPWYRSPDARQWRRMLWNSGALTWTECLIWSLRYYPERFVAWLTISSVRKLRQLARQ